MIKLHEHHLNLLGIFDLDKASYQDLLIKDQQVDGSYIQVTFMDGNKGYLRYIPDVSKNSPWVVEDEDGIPSQVRTYKQALALSKILAKSY